MATLEELYNHYKTLTSQWFYLKSEVNTLLSGKVDKDGSKGLSSNDYTDAEKTKLSGIATGATKVTVDNALSSTSTNPVQNKVINTALGNKVDAVSGKGLSSNDYTNAEKTKLEGIAESANNYTHPSYTAKNSGLYKVTVDNTGHISAATAVAKSDITALGIPGSDTNTTYDTATQSADGLMSSEDKTKLDGIDSQANKYTHPSQSLGTLPSSASLKKIKYDANGHITATSDVVKADITALGIPGSDSTYTPASATPNADTSNGAVGTSSKYAREDHTHPKSTLYAEASHSHSASEITDSTAHSNLETAAGATQATINAAIDSKIGSLTAVDLITVVSTLPTQSASTMNKLYFVPETTAQTNDAYEIFITVKSGNNYSWEKVDSVRIDLSSYATTSAMNTALAGKANSSHAHGNITSAGAIGSTSGKVVVTGTSGVLTTSDMITELNTVVEALIEYGS